jgi:hypothetical protein
MGIDLRDPAAVADLLEHFGLRIERELEEDPPALFAERDGIDLSAWFYGCRGGIACREIVLSAVFDIDGALALRRVNEWNRDELMGRAYLDDEDDVVLEHHMVLLGGVGVSNFRETLTLWDETVDEFADHIRW